MTLQQYTLIPRDQQLFPNIGLLQDSQELNFLIENAPKVLEAMYKIIQSVNGIRSSFIVGAHKKGTCVLLTVRDKNGKVHEARTILQGQQFPYASADFHLRVN